MNDNANVNLLAAWNDDVDVTAAQLAIDAEISAVELARRVSNMIIPVWY
jgi:hypothetical protein